MELIETIRTEVVQAAAEHADDVDRLARFPIESINALRESQALSAAIPRELGGQGCGMLELATMCSTLAGACGSSAMVLAMHHIQVACLARHASSSQQLREYLKDLVTHQYLLGSMTSEVGTQGDTRSSICAVDRSDGRYTLNKDA